MTKLRQALINEIKIRGYSDRTKTSYIYAVAQLAKYYACSPERLTDQQLEDYFKALSLEFELSSATIRLQLNAIHFFYLHVLKRRFEINVPWPKKPQKIPELLSSKEVRAIIEHCSNEKYRTMLAMYYACGLRLSELIHVKVSDVDGERKTLRIVNGKGNKDRNIVLSPYTLCLLRGYWLKYRAMDWLFYSSRSMNKPVGCSSIQKAFRTAKKQTNITKECSIHSLPCLCHASTLSGYAFKSATTPAWA